MTELRSVTCHMGSHSVACYPTQVSAPRLNPSHAGPVRDLPTPEGWKAELTLLLGNAAGLLFGISSIWPRCLIISDTGMKCCLITTDYKWQ